MAGFIPLPQSLRPLNPNSANSSSAPCDLIVAGGGAAGFFAAIACAEACPGARVVILEKSSQTLGKVKISGGGRCNVTHACFDLRELSSFYPRGSKQLLGPFHRWSTSDTMAWFEERGVPLKIEADNRVFPRSDNSQSIVDCLNRAARDAGVIVRVSTAVEGAAKTADGDYEVSLRDGPPMRGRHLLLTTGGARVPIGANIAAGFGHRIESAAPSLFTFKINDPRIAGLQGLSVPRANVLVDPTVGGPKLEAAGPTLITHWGLSGPAILRVSAWGARELHAADYRFTIDVNWSGNLGEQKLMDHFDRLRSMAPKRTLLKDPQFEIPTRLWKRLVEAATMDPVAGAPGNLTELRWPHLSREASRSLASQIGVCRFKVDGKSMNKDEFVTCGGVNLDEVNFKTMESRLSEGLYFAGELLDIDGITGGFNFQSAWTTGRIVGEAIAESIQANES
ncbi:MAG: putative Rossmann fold flavoprotein [Candidatus Binatia bacterium]